MSVPNDFQNFSKIHLLPRPLEIDTVYAFGPFILSERERELTSNGHPLRLKRRDFDVLLILLKNRSKLVTKSQLLDEVWPTSYVSEANLSVHIGCLRKLLGTNSRDHSYIQTVNRFGYRFVGEVNVSYEDRSKPQVPSLEMNEAVSAAYSHSESCSVRSESTEAVFSLTGGLRIEARTGPLGTEIIMIIPESLEGSSPKASEEVRPWKVQTDGVVISSIRLDGIRCIKVAV